MTFLTNFCFWFIPEFDWVAVFIERHVFYSHFVCFLHSVLLVTLWAADYFCVTSWSSSAAVMKPFLPPVTVHRQKSATGNYHGCHHRVPATSQALSSASHYMYVWHTACQAGEVCGFVSSPQCKLISIWSQQSISFISCLTGCSENSTSTNNLTAFGSTLWTEFLKNIPETSSAAGGKTWTLTGCFESFEVASLIMIKQSTFLPNEILINAFLSQKITLHTC